MKSALSFIRWKFVIPAALVTAAVMAFFILMFDPLLARGISALGSKVNGAKVDVLDLKTKIFKGRLQIGQIQVANKNAPMTNTVELGPLVFQLDLENLLKKRVVIPDARIEGIAFGTQRKVSGVLPKPVVKKKKKDEKPGIGAKLAAKYTERFKLNLDGLKGQVQDKIEFDPKDLEITKQSEALKAKSNALPDQWKTKVNDLNVDGRLKTIESDLKSIENTPTKGLEAVTAIPQALGKLKKSKEDLNKIKDDIKGTKNNLSQELNTLKADVKNLKNAKDKDKADLLSRMNLDFADPERLIEGLIGSAVLNRVLTALKYVELARKHLPSKKEKEGLPKKPRAAGMFIEFPRPATPPRFWLQNSGLSGNYKNVDLSGSLVHVTSDPPRVGKPMVLSLKGRKGPQNFLGEITVDHVGDIKKDSLVLEASGLQLKDMTDGGVLGKAMKQGSGSVLFTLSAIGENRIGGEITLNIGNIKFDDKVLLAEAGIGDGPMFKLEDRLKGDFLKNVARAIESMDKVVIRTQLVGTWDDPDIKITSNLKKKLANVLKSTVGNAAKEQREKLEKELNKILQSKQKELTGQVNNLTSKLDGNFAGLDAKVKDQIDKATGINLTPTDSGGEGTGSNPIDDLKSIFK